MECVFRQIPLISIWRIKIKREVDIKTALFISHNKKYKNYTFEKVLLTTERVQKSLKNREFFDYIISLDDIFNAAYWD